MTMRQTRKKKRSYKRVILLGLLLLVIFAGAAYSYIYSGIKHHAVAEPGMMAANSAVHVMVMGVDRRADDAGRSDTLMVAAVDADKGKADILSIPRDTRVQIEGRGYDKINHAYAYGGHELTKKTVESLTGVPMDYYILVDIKAFERIIDALGGIDIQVEKRMHYEDPWDDNGGLVIDLYPGEQHMDGKKAIQYVRYRDGEGDIGRIGRQQKFMKAVLNKVLSPQVLPKLPRIIEEVGSALETDMPVKDMLNMVSLLKKMKDSESGLQAEMVPGKPAYLQDISYWLPDIMALRTMLAGQMGLTMQGEIASAADEAVKQYADSLPQGIQVIEEASESGKTEKAAAGQPGKISVLVINSSGINGAGARVADVLRKKGFIISGVETGKTSSRDKTTITTAAGNTDLFYGMPFSCTIMAGGESKQAVVNIGLDYKK